MALWKSVLLVLLLALLAVLGGTGLLVHRATHPERRAPGSLEVAGDLLKVEEVAFTAADGTALAAWWIPARPGAPAVVLLHDLGEERSSLLPLAVTLHEAGLHVLAPDLRGHGASGGSGSTLGRAEKRDVAAAVDYLSRRADVDHRRVGAYGKGIGATAAVLAAADRPELAVLVLDGPAPDPGFDLTRRVFAGWGFGERHLGVLPRLVLQALQPGVRGTPDLRDVVPVLTGREMLLLAPAGDAALAAEVEAVYRSIPERKDTEGNLVTVSGEDLERHRARVRGFLADRLLGG